MFIFLKILSRVIRILISLLACCILIPIILIISLCIMIKTNDKDEEIKEGWTFIWNFLKGNWDELSWL